ncbi:hypothetical protein [Aquimarina aquimarini]|uniref:hypothetical protein n=1 Tax=Aquimarina aquimarini TaxID=1191734 RepID=UPI000D56111E|nr:hypothetical protein [Aquimarina aquimarini]
MRILMIVVAVMSINFVHAQDKKVEKDSTVVHELTINKDSFGSYPAVILDIDTHKLIKLNAGATEEEVFKSIKVKNGFFIEPSDPEFASISTDGPDVNPRLIVHESNSLEITLEEVEKLDVVSSRLRRESIKTGVLFIVKTYKGIFYKFQIVLFDAETKEIKLRYEKIE